MRGLVLRYYFVLRTALLTHAHLRRCLVRCRHCRIFFLTDPRNAGRRDLGCPFGCGDAHRREASSERSTAYYRTESGRRKKQALNAKRGGGEPAPAAEAVIAVDACETEFDAGIVDHVRLVVSLIEGFPVPREEVVAMLREARRQRRMFRERRIDYVLRWLGEHPP